MNRWMLTQFYVDANGNLQPVCNAYGTSWICPVLPATATQWALVQIAVGQQGLAAAAADSRVLVLPDITDPSTLPAFVVAAYAPPATGSTANAPTFLQVNTATDSISMAQLIHRLAAVEPAFLHGI